MNDLDWTRPELWPWLFAPLLLGPFVHVLLRRARRAAGRYGAPAEGRPVAPLARTLRLVLLAELSLLAWMDPRWGEVEIAVERRGLDLIVCLDTSRSMLARDLVPTRLERALRDVRAVLPSLVGGDRVGLVVFAGDARLRVPLTHDVDSFAQLLDEIDTDVVPTGGTDLAAALRRAGELIDPEQSATTAVVLLTDGEDLAGRGQQAALELRERSVVVHTIGYGSAMGSKIALGQATGGGAGGDGGERFLTDREGREVVSRLDPDSLRALAQATGGEFVRAEALPLPLVELHTKRLLPMQKRAYEAGTENAKESRYQWLLLPLLSLLLIDMTLAGGRMVAGGRR